MDRIERYQCVGALYSFYIQEHSNQTCRRSQVVGTGFSIALPAAAVATLDWRVGLAAVIWGYAFAWAGHAFFEHNRPATFSYTLSSLTGDFRLFFGDRDWPSAVVAGGRARVDNEFGARLVWEIMQRATLGLTPYQSTETGRQSS